MGREREQVTLEEVRGVDVVAVASEGVVVVETVVENVVVEVVVAFVALAGDVALVSVVASSGCVAAIATKVEVTAGAVTALFDVSETEFEDSALSLKTFTSALTQMISFLSLLTLSSTFSSSSSSSMTITSSSSSLSSKGHSNAALVPTSVVVIKLCCFLRRC